MKKYKYEENGNTHLEDGPRQPQDRGDNVGKDQVRNGYLKLPVGGLLRDLLEYYLVIQLKTDTEAVCTRL